MRNDISYQSLAQVLELRPHNRVFDDVHVFNKKEIEYFLYMHIPEELSRDSNLVEVKCVDTCEVLDHELIQRHCKKPWIRIESRLLDTSVGQHTYRFVFINTATDDVYSLYISYIIQDDNPDKPYIYMNGKEEDDGLCNICKQIVPGQ